jgi:hypothetical protein
MDGLSNSSRHATTASSSGEAPDENTIVDKMLAHPNAIA